MLRILIVVYIFITLNHTTIYHITDYDLLQFKHFTLEVLNVCICIFVYLTKIKYLKIL